MVLPQVGQTISADEFNKLPAVGETISADQFNALGAQEQPQKTGFLQRLKLSFGGKKAEEQIKTIEEQQGTAGRFDIGDIADIAGKALPAAGAVLGGVAGAGAVGVGAIPGSALGAAGGEAVRRLFGRAISAPTDTAGQDIKEIAKEGAYTYAGGKALTLAAKVPGVKQAISYATTKLPERLYSTFFKTTADDLSNLARTGVIKNLQNTNPELYGKLVSEGIVRVGKTGAVEINPTLAQEALERGMGGSLEKMAGYSIQKQMELELAARQVAKNVAKPIKLENAKGFLGMLGDVSKAFKKEGYGFLSKSAQEADTLANVIKKGNGNVTAENMLKLRRLLDSLRNTSSFRGSPTMSPKQAIFKEGADMLRKRLAEIPGMKGVMNEYRFNIEAADSLITEAARRGNNKIFGLFDAVVGGSSIGALGVPGIGVYATVRTVQTPTVLTAIARGLAGVPGIAKKTLPFITRPAGQAVRKLFGN